MPVSGGSQPADGPSAIQYGWNKFKDNWGEIIVAVLIGLAIVIVVEIIVSIVIGGIAWGSGDGCSVSQSTGRIHCDSGPGFFSRLFGFGVLQALFWVAGSVFQLWIIQATLQLVRGERLEASRIMSFEKFGPFVLAALLVGVLTVVGFILLIIPGLLVLFFTHFYGFFVVDKDMSPIEAITASFNLVKEHIGVVLIFFLLSLLVLLVGAILCGIGLIVAWPVVIIATGYMYKRLQGEPVAA